MKINIRKIKQIRKLGEKAGWKIGQPLAIKTYKQIARIFKDDPDVQEYVREIIDAIEKRDSEKHKMYMNLLRAHILTKRVM